MSDQNMTSGQMQETFLQTVELIANATVGDYTVTEIATIVEPISTKVEDKTVVLAYWVQTNTIKYQAKPLDENTYEKGDQVYINIPNNDYSNEKIILGKVTSAEQVEAEAAQVSITELLIQNNFVKNKHYNYFKNISSPETASSEEPDNIMYLHVDSKNPIELPKSFNAFGSQTHLMLSFALQSIASGGKVRVDVTCNCYTSFEENSSPTTLSISYDSSKEAIGNPFVFSADSKIYKIIELPKNTRYVTIGTIVVTNELNADLELHSLDIYTGYLHKNLNLTDTTGIKLACINQDTGEFITSLETTESLDKASLIVSYYDGDWIYDQDNISLNNLEVHWSRYELLSGTGVWSTIRTSIVDKNTLSLELKEHYNLAKSREFYLAEFMELGSQEAIYKANEVTIINSTIGAVNSSQTEGGIILSVNDDGIYQYDYGNNLYENEGAGHILTAELTESDKYTIKEVEWYVPKNKTLYAAPSVTISNITGNGFEYVWNYTPEEKKTYQGDIAKLDLSEEESIQVLQTLFGLFNKKLYVWDFKANKYTASLAAISMELAKDLIDGDYYKFITFKPQLNFYIDSKYYSLNQNNTIKCNIITEEETKFLDGKFTPSFQTTGSSGTPYRLAIEFDDSYPEGVRNFKSSNNEDFKSSNNEEQIYLKATLYDNEGVALNPQPSINWYYYNTYNLPREDIFSNNGWYRYYEERSIVIGEEAPIKQDIYYPSNIQTISDTTYVSIQNKIHTMSLFSSYQPINTMTSEPFYFEYIKPLNFTEDDIGKEYKLYIKSDSKSLFGLGQISSYWNTIITDNMGNISYQPTYLISQLQQGNEEIIYNLKIIEGNEQPPYYDANEDKYIIDINYKGNNDYEVKLCILMYPPKDKDMAEVKPFDLELYEKSQANKEEIAKNKQSIVIDAVRNKGSTKSATILATVQLETPSVKIQSFFPIPYYSSTDYAAIGQNQIIYNSFGVETFKQEEEFKFYSGKTDITSDSVFSIYPKGENIVLPTDLYFNNNILSLPNIAPAEIMEYEIIISDKDDNVLAAIPLLLQRNTYEFQEINAWGGITETTDDYVMSPMVIAGIKNDKNQFSGVMMGTHSAFPTTGLYGFKNGVATFGFSEDGNAFLGADPATGRIEFVPTSQGGYLLVNAEIDRSSVYRFDTKTNINGLTMRYPLSKITSKAQFKEVEHLVLNQDWSNDVLFSGLVFDNKGETEILTAPKGTDAAYICYLGRTIGYNKGNTFDFDDYYLPEQVTESTNLSGFRGPTFILKDSLKTKSNNISTEDPFIFIHAKRTSSSDDRYSTVLLSTSPSDSYSIEYAENPGTESNWSADMPIPNCKNGAYLQLRDRIDVWGYYGIHLNSNVYLPSKTPIYFNYPVRTNADFIQRTSDNMFQISTTSTYLRIVVNNANRRTYYDFTTTGIVGPKYD